MAAMRKKRASAATKATHTGSTTTRRTRRAKAGEPEKVIQKRILTWLGTTGLLYWRANSGWACVGPRMIRLGPDGMPDIVVVIPPSGRFVGLEVKTEDGTLRASQEAFAAKLTKAGGKYYVVRSLAAAKDAVAGEVGQAKDDSWAMEVERW